MQQYFKKLDRGLPVIKYRIFISGATVRGAGAYIELRQKIVKQYAFFVAIP
jgi:hypothetical protein